MRVAAIAQHFAVLADFNGFSFLISLLFDAFILIPILIGFTWMRVDANRNGQPGLLWAVLTIPFSWFALLGYLIVRTVVSGQQRRW